MTTAPTAPGRAFEVVRSGSIDRVRQIEHDRPVSATNRTITHDKLARDETRLESDRDDKGIRFGEHHVQAGTLARRIAQQLPPGRLKLLRDAVDATMKDPDFIADANKRKLDLSPESGADLAALIDKIYTTPWPIVEKIDNLIQ